MKGRRSDGWPPSNHPSRHPARRWRNGPSRGLRSICLNAVRWCWNTNCGGTRWSMYAGRTWSWLRFRLPRGRRGYVRYKQHPGRVTTPGSAATRMGDCVPWRGMAFVDVRHCALDTPSRMPAWIPSNAKPLNASCGRATSSLCFAAGPGRARVTHCGKCTALCAKTDMR